MDKARSAALAALLRVRVDEGYSNIVFDKTVRSLNISPRDTAFASALFMGSLKKELRWITVYHFILRFPFAGWSL